MGEFITGILTANDPNAQHEGVVYDRWITLQHASGMSLDVFDPFPPMSGDLSVGTKYEVIVSALGPV